MGIRPKIYLGADHRGFALKEKISQWLFKREYEFEDLGALSFNPNDDYPKYAAQVASMVKSSFAKATEDRGILFCGSGIGVDVVANKFDGIRAGLGKSEEQVRAGRKHDNMNILVIAADFTQEKEAEKMVQAFLETKFDWEEKHEKRLQDIQKIEENN